MATTLLMAASFGYGLDLSRPPAEQWTAVGVLWSIDLYQARFRGTGVGAGVRCRFDPTCSRYAEASIERYGAGRGALRSGWRLLRCGPWTPHGTHDPP